MIRRTIAATLVKAGWEVDSWGHYHKKIVVKGSQRHYRIALREAWVAVDVLGSYDSGTNKRPWHNHALARYKSVTINSNGRLVIGRLAFRVQNEV